MPENGRAEDMVAAVRRGERRAIARALTTVENEPQGALSAALYPFSGGAHLIGITGAPGSGKSTLVSAMIGVYRERGQTVGVVAVDPSSPFTGGAVLGDRVRMGVHSGDPGVFIRSMASRGSVGGLSQATSDAVRVLDAAGFEAILIETVGAGQAEVEIVDEAHTTVVVVVPGLGDDIQAIKAGILEIADIYCVNKSDHTGADRTVAQLKSMLTLGMREREPDWFPPVVCTVATSGDGVPLLVDKIAEHRQFLLTSGAWEERERLRAGAELRRRLHARLVEETLGAYGERALAGLLERLARRQIDPESAVEELLKPAADPVAAA